MRFIIALALSTLTVNASGWPTVETEAPQAIVMDMETGECLFEKNADEPTVPSSMTKMMTVYMVFKKLKEGQISLQTRMPVSERAWRMGGSRMFLPLNAQETVDNLLRGIIIQSGNDACVTVAEALKGSVEGFAQDMTQEARKLGAKNTTFKNPHGWPEEGHLTTVRDLAIIAQRMILDFPNYYPLHAEKEFFYNNIKQVNRNPLLFRNVGCDGIKTGHTDAGGYGLVASAEINGHRLIMVVNGLKSEKHRAEESMKLLTWAQRTFAGVRAFKANTKVAQVPVVFGAQNTVTVVTPAPAAAVYLQGQDQNLQVRIEQPNYIKAPVVQGMQVGQIVITLPQGQQKVFPLVAQSDVPSGGFFKRISDSLQLMTKGSLA